MKSGASVGAGTDAYKSFAQSLLQSSHNSEPMSSLSEGIMIKLTINCYVCDMLLYVLNYFIFLAHWADSEVAALQDLKQPTASTKPDKQNGIVNESSTSEEIDDDFDNSLSLPLSDSPPKQKSVKKAFMM